MFLMVKPSKTLTLGRLQASLVCSRLIAFFMVLDSLDQLHRVAESRLSDLISDAKLVIKNMQNKHFFDLFLNYFDIKIAKHWNSIIYKTKTYKNPPKTSLFSWKHFTQNWRFFFWLSVAGWFSVPCISAHFRPIFRVVAEITAICLDEYFYPRDYIILTYSLHTYHYPPHHAVTQRRSDTATFAICDVPKIPYIIIYIIIYYNI